MKNFKTIIILILNILSVQLNAQDKIQERDTMWYLNGDYELISNYEFIDSGRILLYENKKGKYKDVETFFLFSINKADGTQNIIYKPLGEEEGDTLTVEEMRAFVRGGHCGYKEYKAPISTIEGLIVGFSSPFFVASFGLNPFYSILIPAMNSTLVGATSPSTRRITKKYPELSKNPMFIEGYKEAAKRKRTKNSIVGGLVGIVTGVATVLIIITR